MERIALDSLQMQLRNVPHLKKRDIYLFGVNNQARETIKILVKWGAKVCGILDNDFKKQGSYIRGIRVMSVTSVKNITNRRKLFVIDSPYWREMKAQLLSMGVDELSILVVFLPYVLDNRLSTHVKAIFRGRKIYRKLQAEYGKASYFLLCPYTGTGDIYLIGTLLPAWLRENNISDYVLIVPTSACRKVASLFQLPKIHQLENLADITYLIKYYLCCPDDCKMKVLNDSWGEVYTNPTEWIRGLHGMNFTQMFTRFVFDTGKDARPEIPKFLPESDRVQKVLDQYHVIPSKCILLSPYANTLSDITIEFWKKLSDSLAKCGYQLFTNSSGEEEPPLPNTKALFFPLDIAPQAVSKMAGFIGLRSGFCDVVSAAKTRKVILYDKDAWFYNSTVYEYFSLNKMGLCDDAIEIEYDNESWMKTIDMILNNLPMTVMT